MTKRTQDRSLTMGERLDNLGKRHGWVSWLEVRQYPDLVPLWWKRRMWAAKETLDTERRGSDVWHEAYEGYLDAKSKWDAAIQANWDIRKLERLAQLHSERAA